MEQDLDLRIPFLDFLGRRSRLESPYGVYVLEDISILMDSGGYCLYATYLNSEHCHLSKERFYYFFDSSEAACPTFLDLPDHPGFIKNPFGIILPNMYRVGWKGNAGIHALFSSDLCEGELELLSREVSFGGNIPEFKFGPVSGLLLSFDEFQLKRIRLTYLNFNSPLSSKRIRILNADYASDNQGSALGIIYIFGRFKEADKIRLIRQSFLDKFRSSCSFSFRNDFFGVKAGGLVYEGYMALHSNSPLVCYIMGREVTPVGAFLKRFMSDYIRSLKKLQMA